MFIVVLVVLCIAFLAVAVLQTIRLCTLQQKMDVLRQHAEHEILNRETLWHDMVHDLRNPAACVFALSNLIQENRAGAPKQLSHFLDEIHRTSAQILQVLNNQVPPRPDMKVVFGDVPTPSDAGDKAEQKKQLHT